MIMTADDRAAGESRPPRIIAGNAASAIRPTLGVTGSGAGAERDSGQGGDTAGDRPRQGEHPAYADAPGERRLLVDTPSPASRRRCGRTGRTRRSRAARQRRGPSAQRSFTARTTPPALTVLMPHGSPRSSASKPQMLGDDLLEQEQQADRDHDHAEHRLADHAAQQQALYDDADERTARHGHDAAPTRRAVPTCGGNCKQVGAERHEAALGEVDDAGGLVDDHEAQAPPARSGSRAPSPAKHSCRKSFIGTSPRSGRRTEM